MNLAISSSFLLSYPDSSLAHPHFYLSLVGLPKSKTESLDRTFGSNFIGTKVKLQAARLVLTPFSPCPLKSGFEWPLVSSFSETAANLLGFLVFIPKNPHTSMGVWTISADTAKANGACEPNENGNTRRRAQIPGEYMYTSGKKSRLCEDIVFLGLAILGTRLFTPRFEHLSILRDLRFPLEPHNLWPLYWLRLSGIF
jgi:hypothetical protein